MRLAGPCDSPNMQLAALMQLGAATWRTVHRRNARTKLLVVPVVRK